MTQYHEPILPQKISRTTKRIKEDVEAYLEPESKMRFNFDQQLQKDIITLSEKSCNRFYDYIRLAQDYLRIGDMYQVALHDIDRCKDYLYKAATCQWVACQYFDPQKPMSSHYDWRYVNYRKDEFFESAIIADADALARRLGEYLLGTDRGSIVYDAWETYRVADLLYLGQDNEASQACTIVKNTTKSKALIMMIDVYEALLEKNCQRFYDSMIASIRRNRRDPNLIWRLNTWAIAMGKIAVKRGVRSPLTRRTVHSA